MVGDLSFLASRSLPSASGCGSVFDPSRMDGRIVVRGMFVRV